MDILKKILINLCIILTATLCYAASEDFTGFTEVDPGADITVNSASLITLSNLDNANTDSYVYTDKGAGAIANFTGQIDHNPSSASNFKFGTAIFGVSNSVNDMGGWTDSAALAHRNANVGGEWVFRIYKDGATVVDTSGVVTGHAARYFDITRSGTTFTVDGYTDSGRTTLDETITGTIASSSFRYLYAVATENTSTSGRLFSATIENMDYTATGGGGGGALPVLIRTIY